MKRIYLPILMYHKISSNETGNSYEVPLKSFEEQMQYLHNNGFKTVVPEELSGSDKNQDSKLIMLTFDDGYETDYTAALPILNKLGLKAVSFVTTGFMGREGYMKWEQLQELEKQGFSVQSHTHSHPLLKAMDAQTIKEELYNSKKLIEEKLNKKVTSLSFPGGSYSEKALNIALEQGYDHIFNSVPKINIINNSVPVFLGRLLITRGTSLVQFKRIVNLDKLTIRKAKLGYCVKNFLRGCIGTEKYYRLWKKNREKREGDKWN